MKHLISIFLLSTFLIFTCRAASRYESRISSLQGEKWWGGMVANLRLFDLSAENLNNQTVPLLLSSEGRYIWSDKPFAFKMEEGELRLYSDYEKLEPILAGRTLRDAYRAACQAHFPPSGELPDSLFRCVPRGLPSTFPAFGRITGFAVFLHAAIQYVD